MEYREITCICCGAKAIDMSKTKTKKYCSEQCAWKQYRRNHGVGVKPVITPSCIYNEEVECKNHKCGSCGWNPKVEKKRKEAIAYG